MALGSNFFAGPTCCYPRYRFRPADQSWGTQKNIFVGIFCPLFHMHNHSYSENWNLIFMKASSGESLSASDGIVSFCVTKSFVVTIHNGDRRLPPYFGNRSNSSSPTDYTSEEIELPRDFEANRRSKKSSPVSSSLRLVLKVWIYLKIVS